MRAVFVDVPASLLAERARLGLDIRDEMWEGELHMAPQPTGAHQLLTTELAALLVPVAKRLGLRAVVELALTTTADSYRVPDLVVVDPAHLGDRGIEVPPSFAVEVRSPDDETYRKLSFYATFGVPELLVIDRDTKAVELFRLHDGELVADAPDDEGWVRSTSLDLVFRTAAGPKVEVDVAGERHLIP